LFDNADLNVETMQAVVHEDNLCETAFVRQSDLADFGQSYFTTEEEILLWSAIPLFGWPCG
jgi:trans-2,3-dihydro-3-hydroxyanthranilate isomerase